MDIIRRPEDPATLDPGASPSIPVRKPLLFLALRPYLPDTTFETRPNGHRPKSYKHTRNTEHSDQFFREYSLDYMRAAMFGRTANRISRAQPVARAPSRTDADHSKWTVTGICLHAEEIDTLDLHRILRRSVVLMEKAVLSVAIQPQLSGRAPLSSNRVPSRGALQLPTGIGWKPAVFIACSGLTRRRVFWPPKGHSRTAKRRGFRGRKPLQNQPAF